MKFLAIAKKDILIYYLKGPVLIFGVLLPLFLFLAFWIGRQLELSFLMAGLISMTAFFSATSVTPFIAPWEGQVRTLERLMACPVSVTTLILGDVTASFTFGTAISFVPVALAVMLGLQINFVLLTPALILSSLCFSLLGLLFSSYPTNIPSTVMMISSLTRFPLVFISGIFIPIESLPSWGRLIALLSPLTYLTDIVRASADSSPFLPLYTDFAALLGFSILFFVLTVKLHERALLKRL